MLYPHAESGADAGNAEKVTGSSDQYQDGHLGTRKRWSMKVDIGYHYSWKSLETQLGMTMCRKKHWQGTFAVAVYLEGGRSKAKDVGYCYTTIRRRVLGSEPEISTAEPAFRCFSWRAENGQYAAGKGPEIVSVARSGWPQFSDPQIRWGEEDIERLAIDTLRITPCANGATMLNSYQAQRAFDRVLLGAEDGAATSTRSLLEIGGCSTGL